MKKIKPCICLLFVCLFLLSACMTTTKQQSQVFPTELKKSKQSIKCKKKLSPAFIQVIQSPERLRIILYSDVCFQPNGLLTAQCANQLSNRMKLIKRFGNGLIQVVGYTDDSFDTQTAEKIAQQQADTVVAFLWLKGIGSQRLCAIGFGNHDPVASNQSVEASAANRRVEIRLVK